ncbi:hypothetical protein HKX48_007021 [Thoreauomyces humboldtii]|nr:hypothetical protein HKX48_007021 [Thoreauomyces humboldtii]
MNALRRTTRPRIVRARRVELVNPSLLDDAPPTRTQDHLPPPDEATQHGGGDFGDHDGNGSHHEDGGDPWHFGGSNPWHTEGRHAPPRPTNTDPSPIPDTPGDEGPAPTPQAIPSTAPQAGPRTVVTTVDQTVGGEVVHQTRQVTLSGAVGATVAGASATAAPVPPLSSATIASSLLDNPTPWAKTPAGAISLTAIILVCLAILFFLGRLFLRRRKSRRAKGTENNIPLSIGTTSYSSSADELISPPVSSRTGGEDKSHFGQGAFGSELTEEQLIDVGIRTQRDLSLALPVNRGGGAGITLNSQVFNKTYTPEVLANTENFVVTYGRRLVLDVYWDNFAKNWQLCPEAYPTSTGIAISSANYTNGTSPTVNLGDVVCSQSPLTISDLGNALLTWMASGNGGQNENTVVVVILNLHDLRLVASLNNTTPVQNISTAVNTGQIYTPQMLQNYQDFNSSTSAYSAVVSGNGTVTHPAPWPKGSDLVSAGKQILVGFGSSDLSSTSGYDPVHDQDVIFSAGDLDGIPILSTTAVHSPLTSCANPAPGIAMVGTGFDVSDANYTAVSVTSGTTNVSWSWPYVVEAASAPFTIADVAALSHCGFQPIFTASFSSALMAASIWSWASGMPSTAVDGANCAVINKSSGRWSVDLCKASYPVACQLLSGDPNLVDPYNWMIVPSRYTFPDAAEACVSPYVFSVPKSAQENAALVSVLAASSYPNVWINLYQGGTTCWVEGYLSSCPYAPSDLLPSLIGATLKQGIVIVIVFALFVFFKCRRQLRVSRLNKRKAEVRRKIRQRDYVTVPA